MTIQEAQERFENTGHAAYADADNNEIVSVSPHGGYESSLGPIDEIRAASEAAEHSATTDRGY